MRETKRSSKDIIKDMLSGDADKIWSASCAICSLSQNHDKVMELVPYKEKMYYATRNIELGGAIALNNRFLKKAFEVMEVHEEGKECPCILLGGDSNPKHLLEDGYIELMDVVYSSNSGYIDYYMVRCNRCKKGYKVEEREYHYTWWSWQVLKE